jgi:hypothetical protein
MSYNKNLQAKMKTIRQQQLHQNGREVESNAAVGAAAFVQDMPASIDASLDDDSDDAEAYEELSEEETEEDIMARVSRNRVAPRTRSAYDDFIRKQVQWAAANGFEEFVNFVQHGETLAAVGLKLPLSVEFVDKYLEYVENKKVPIARYTQTTLPTMFEKNVSPSYFKLVCLAMFDVYINESKCIAFNVEHLLRCRRLAFCRRITELKKNRLYPLASTHYCTFRGYEAINRKIIALQPDGNKGSWSIMLSLFSFVTLLWNMLSRCASIASLGWEHFGWSGDSMTIKVPGSKCDQAGIYAYAKRVYANTCKPWICPVLASALAFFCRKGSCTSVFPDADTVRNTLRHFKEVCSTFSQADCQELGCDVPNLAFHDFKRGGVSFVSGLSDAVNNVAVKIRADHRVVDISRCYVLETSGQDGVIGRLLSGLPYGESEFANTCPHFSSNPDIDWKELINDYDHFTPAFRNYVLPHFLATVIFHLPWLEANLPASHPFRTGFGLRNRALLLRLRTSVSGGSVMSVERRAAETGISAAVKTSIRVQELEEKVVQAVQSAVAAAVTEVLKQHDRQPTENLADAVGAAANAACTAATLQLSGPTLNAAHIAGVSVDGSAVVGDPVPMYHAVMRGLPRGFQLGSLSIENLFNCWHIGQPFPYKLITKRHLSDLCSDADVLQRQSTTMCRYRGCAIAIEEAAGMKVHADASNLQDVFNAGICKLQTEFNIDKDTAATYAYEAMRKRRRIDDSVPAAAPQAPVPPFPVAQAPVLLAPVQPFQRALYGANRAAAEKAVVRQRQLEESAKQYDLAQIAQRPLFRAQAAAARKSKAPPPQPPPRHNPDLALFDASDCDDAAHWPAPSNWRISADSRRCFQCTLCQTWHRDKAALNQHGDRRHAPWERVLHVRDVAAVVWCLKTGARGQWSPSLHTAPPQ